MTDRAKCIRHARTLLFVPGARPDRFDRAVATAAELVVVDLEASVRPADKASARAALLGWLPTCAAAHRVLVRINSADSPWFAEDVAALSAASCAGIVLPMALSAARVAAAIAILPPTLPVVALIETAAGILDAARIATVPGVVRLAFGNMDYATDTGTRGRDSTIHPSAILVMASRAAQLPSPIAGVTAAFRDLAKLEDEAVWERDQGFGAKFCIHPEQLPIVARAFTPTAAELAWARRVLAAADGSYAFELDGELVDRPVVERARRLVAATGVDGASHGTGDETQGER